MAKAVTAASRIDLEDRLKMIADFLAAGDDKIKWAEGPEPTPEVWSEEVKKFAEPTAGGTRRAMSVILYAAGKAEEGSPLQNQAVERLVELKDFAAEANKANDKKDIPPTIVSCRHSLEAQMSVWGVKGIFTVALAEVLQHTINIISAKRKMDSTPLGTACTNSVNVLQRFYRAKLQRRL